MFPATCFSERFLDGFAYQQWKELWTDHWVESGEGDTPSADRKRQGCPQVASGPCPLSLQV